jgi:hypothetical protein
MYWSDSRRGFGLDIGFIDHLYTRRGPTSDYSATANLHTLQITSAQAKSFPAYCVFTSCSLVTASNSGDSSASTFKSSLNGGSLPTDSFLHRLPCRTDLVVPVFFLITPRHGPRRQHTVYSRMLTVSAGMCSRHPTTVCVTPFIKNLLPHQRALFRYHYPATGVHVTM